MLKLSNTAAKDSGRPNPPMGAPYMNNHSRTSITIRNPEYVYGDYTATKYYLMTCESLNLAITPTRYTPTARPIDGTTYTASLHYGSGDAIGNGFVVLFQNDVKATLSYLIDTLPYSNKAYGFALYVYDNTTKIYSLATTASFKTTL